MKQSLLLDRKVFEQLANNPQLGISDMNDPLLQAVVKSLRHLTKEALVEDDRNLKTICIYVPRDIVQNVRGHMRNQFHEHTPYVYPMTLIDRLRVRGRIKTVIYGTRFE